MKKKTLLILTVLITALACLFTSCSASVEPPKAEEEFGYVTFGNGGSRSLTTLYGIKNYDDLYWYYTAEKKDGFGLTGQKTEQTRINETKGLSGTVGPLSQGAWVFTLYAYEGVNGNNTGNNLVYQGTSATIVLKGGETKAVPVSVDLKGEYGVVDLSRAYFEWANNSIATGSIYVTVELAKDGSTPTTYFFGPLTRSGNKYTFAATTDTKTVAEGYYTCTVNAYMEEDVNVTGDTVNADATPLATQTLGLRVYGNATTYITGNLTEGIFAHVVFDVAEQDMKVFVPLENGSAEITGISVTPSGESDKTTSVVFSEGALSDIQDNATLQLDVKVTPVESANEKFSIAGVDSSNRSAFAGIDITLMQTTANGQSVAVDSFNTNSNTTARITTYIATGLDNLSVVYNGTDGKSQPKCNDGADSSKLINAADVYTTDSDMGDKLGYSKESGKLVFETSHFSEYYILADTVAVNVNKNIAYSDLPTAISLANSGDTIRLYKDVVLEENYIELTKSITLEGVLNGEEQLSITSGSGIDRVVNIMGRTNDISLVINNLNIEGPTTGSYTRGISAYNNSGKLYIELNNCEVSANYYALNIASANSDVEVVVKNSTAVAGWCAVQSWSPNAKFTFENSTLIGHNDKSYNAEGWNNFATVVINENTINNEFIFKNCRIEANQTTGNKQYLLSVRSSGNKVVLDNCSYFANGKEIEPDAWGYYINLYTSDLILVLDGTTIPIGN